MRDLCGRKLGINDLLKITNKRKDIARKDTMNKYEVSFGLLSSTRPSVLGSRRPEAQHFSVANQFLCFVYYGAAPSSHLVHI